MLDAYITAMNSQIVSARWLNEISDNMMNVYSPGYKAKRVLFKSFLNWSDGETYTDVRTQGKAIPSLTDENMFIEGRGYFALRNDEGRIAYTRYGDFKFDGEGALRSRDGSLVQGYLVNEQGEIVNGAKSQEIETLEGLDFKSSSIPSSDIKLWIDPANGRFLGKYEEFEIKDDGILYGKADKGAVCTPLYKIAVINFNAPENLFEIKPGQFIETEESGNSVIGNAKVRGKALEQSNVDFTAESVWFQQAQFQLSAADMLTKSNRKLLEQVMGLIGQ